MDNFQEICSQLMEVTEGFSALNRQFSESFGKMESTAEFKEQMSQLQKASEEARESLAPLKQGAESLQDGLAPLRKSLEEFQGRFMELQKAMQTISPSLPPGGSGPSLEETSETVLKSIKQLSTMLEKTKV